LARFDFSDIDTHIDVRVAAKNLAAARAAAAQAEADLAKAYVRAPTDGRVLTIAVRAGERPGEAGIMTVGAVARMMAEVEVYQSHIGVVRLGDAATITAEALPRPLSGTVTRIGISVGRQSITAADPAANTDARVIKVEATLDPASAQVAARFSNLEAVARIRGTAQR
jgi:HlyD family secretion protein